MVSKWRWKHPIYRVPDFWFRVYGWWLCSWIKVKLTFKWRSILWCLPLFQKCKYLQKGGRRHSMRAPLYLNISKIWKINRRMTPPDCSSSIKNEIFKIWIGYLFKSSSSSKILKKNDKFSGWAASVQCLSSSNSCLSWIATQLGVSCFSQKW